MLNTAKYTENIRSLFSEVKTYLELQKKYIAMDTADKLITILSTVFIAAICLVFGAIILFFSMFALAYWLGQLVDSIAIGFLIIAVVNLLLIITFYRNRRQWVILPLAKFIISLFMDNTKNVSK